MSDLRNRIEDLSTTEKIELLDLLRATAAKTGGGKKED
jgi:hypothetical protein